MRNLLLLLETSGPTSSVALAQRTKGGWRVLAKAPQDGDAPQPIMRHTEQLLPLIKQVLPPDGWSKLAVVATSSGPGSYTALRAGLSSAKGICLAQDVKLIQASTMRGLAAVQASGSQPPILDAQGAADAAARVLTLLPARRDEVYAAIYEGANLVEVMAPTVVQNDSAWREAMLSTGISTVCASDAALLEDFDTSHVNQVFANLDARNLLWECALRISENQYDDLATTVPLYVRAPFITQAKTRL